jgi:hypothetical protein
VAATSDLELAADLIASEGWDGNRRGPLPACVRYQWWMRFWQRGNEPGAPDKPGALDEPADRAARHLGLYGDRPQQIQASLVVALAVLRRAASACDQAEQATRAGQRATVLFDA